MQKHLGQFVAQNQWQPSKQTDSIKVNGGKAKDEGKGYHRKHLAGVRAWDRKRRERFWRRTRRGRPWRPTRSGASTNSVKAETWSWWSIGAFAWKQRTTGKEGNEFRKTGWRKNKQVIFFPPRGFTDIYYIVSHRCLWYWKLNMLDIGGRQMSSKLEIYAFVDQNNNKRA